MERKDRRGQKLKRRKGVVRYRKVKGKDDRIVPKNKDITMFNCWKKHFLHKFIYVYM